MNGPHMTFFGNLTQDPEQRYTKNDGIPYTRLRVAVNTYRRDQAAETHYFDVDLWRYQADRAMESCTKGQFVFVTGQYSCETFQRNDGSAGAAHHVNAKEFRIIPRSLSQDQAPTPAAASSQPGVSDDAHETEQYEGPPDTMDDVIDVPPAQNL